jgi:ribosomal protein S27E
MRAEAGRPLPDYIEQEFDAYLKCGRLEEGFLRVRCETCHAEKLVAFSCKKRGFCPSCAARRMAETAALLAQVLGVVYRVISGDLLKRAGLTRTTGHTGAVTLIQRFGSALNLNIHFHMLLLDGVYRVDGTGAPVFRQSAAPSAPDLQALLERIALRIGQTLEKRGLIERDIENAWLAEDGEGGPLDDLLGHSITYRIAVGPRAGQKLFTLQTVPARSPQWLDDPGGAARAGGFSLHAGIDIAPGQRARLERLCRYVSR